MPNTERAGERVKRELGWQIEKRGGVWYLIPNSNPDTMYRCSNAEYDAQSLALRYAERLDEVGRIVGNVRGCGESMTVDELAVFCDRIAALAQEKTP